MHKDLQPKKPQLSDGQDKPDTHSLDLATKAQPKHSHQIKDSEDLIDPYEQALSRKRKIALIVGITLLAIIFALVSYFIIRPRLKAAIVFPAAPKQTVPSPLTGVEVSKEDAASPIVGVVIENLYPNARPQSGLSSAGVVYEVVTESGITRYLAVYQDTPAVKATDFGPVRSLRQAFVNWGLEYNMPIAHAGGNGNALALAKQTNMKDINAFSYGNLFRRITTRFAPHNLYITGENLTKLLVEKNFISKPDFSSWKFKDDSKADSPSASVVSVNFSSPDYAVTFEYDPVTNSYKRKLRGVYDVDANGIPIQPKNVVVMQADFSQTRAPETDEMTTTYNLIGTGPATVFRDGKAIKGTWKKAAYSERTRFYDESGNEIELDKGMTWVCVLPTGRTFSFQ